MRIDKIGTFNKQGMPEFWQVNCNGMEKGESVGTAILSIKDNKVFVDRVEIVEWTNACLEIMALDE